MSRIDEGRDGAAWEPEDPSGAPRSRRRGLLITAGGIGLALALVGGVVTLQNRDPRSDEASLAPVALSPDGLSTNVTDAEVAAGESVAAGALGGQLAAPAGADRQVPLTALVAYRRAEASLAVEKPSCHLPWWLLAGIARVESDHADGRNVDPNGNVTPVIRGPRLDGSVLDTRMVLDTDQGMFDQDQQYDRAMGTMQFVPGTWRLAGRDGNGDGTVSQDNVYDAALSAAGYLCSEGADLATGKGLAATVLRYNNRPAYLSDVLAWGTYYRSTLTPAPQAPAPPSTATVPAVPGPGVPVTPPSVSPVPTVPSTGPTPPTTAPGTATNAPTTPGRTVPPVPTRPPSTPVPTRTVPPVTPTAPGSPTPAPTSTPTRTVTPDPAPTRDPDPTRDPTPTRDPDPEPTRETPTPTRPTENTPTRDDTPTSRPSTPSDPPSRPDTSPEVPVPSPADTPTATRSRSVEPTTGDDVPAPTGSDLPALPDETTPSGSVTTATTTASAPDRA